MKTAFALLLAAIFSIPGAALAQSGQPFGSPKTSPEPAPAAQPEVVEESEPAFYAGDIDLMIGGGINGFAYPHIEPAVDIGVIPLTDDFSISVGGGVDLGWCLLCAALDAASDLDFSSSYVMPYGRILLHLGTLGGLLDNLTDDFTIDLNGGVMGGPSFYTFRVAEEDVPDPQEWEFNSTSVILGPVLGGRLGFADNMLFAFLEYRFTLEFGLERVEFNDTNGDVIVYEQDTFTQEGSSVMLGVGFRI